MSVTSATAADRCHRGREFTASPALRQAGEAMYAAKGAGKGWAADGAAE